MIRVKPTGLQSAINLLVRLRGEKKGELIVSTMKKLGRNLVKLVRKRTPKRSGTMRRAITHRVKKSKDGELVFLIVGVLSKYEGSFEGKKVVSHKIGHLVVGRRKQFTQRIVMTLGKSLVVYRKFREGKQIGLAVLRNRRRMAYVLTRKVGEHKPDDIFDTAKRWAGYTVGKTFLQMLRRLIQ